MWSNPGITVLLLAGYVPLSKCFNLSELLFSICSNDSRCEATLPFITST